MNSPCETPHSPERNSEKIIELKNVNFSYNRKLVLENISFEVRVGDYIGIIGPNGGGKTSLLNIILGLKKPESGQVMVFGKKIEELNGERARIGYVPQRLSELDDNFPGTVREIVESGRTALNGLFHKFSRGDKEAVEKAMAVAEVGQFRNKLINDLSGGERQRVMIARALAGEPKVLILDEPTTGVDINSQEQFYKFLADLNRNQGLTVIFVSHDIDVITKEVQSLLLLNKKVICFGPAKGLITKDYLAELYGEKINFPNHKH
jgi:zinc transport system ATP-binding protein